MGGSGTTGTTNQGPPVVPGYLDPYLNSYLGDYAAATSELPSLSSLYQNFPLQGTAPLTGQQNTDINAFQTGSPILTPQQQQASSNLTELGNPQVAQQAFQQFAAPEVMQQAALSGTANGGAVPYSLAQAAIPYELSDQQTQLAANTANANIGSQGMEQLQSALTAAGLPQQEAQQILNSLFAQQSGQNQFATSLQTAPASLLGETIGGGVQVNSAPKF